MKKVLPLLLLLIGTGAGVGAGLFLKPKHEASKDQQVEAEIEQPSEDKEEHAPEYVELNNQFVIPVVNNDLVDSLVVLSLGIELEAGQAEEIYRREPKLRDAMLQVLFDHANMGGFDGRFTDGNNMDVLRVSLTEAAQSIVGQIAHGVVITDIARQDV